MDGADDGKIYGADIPFARLCGIEALEVVEGRTQLRLELGPQHGNNLGIAHGGILCTLLDIAMGTVARLTAGRPVVTLDMQTRFLSPGHGTLLAEGRVTRAGQSILFCDAEIRDTAGRVVATATGVFKPVGVKGMDAQGARTKGAGAEGADVKRADGETSIRRG